MRPVFADPKTDVAFKKLFGTESHKPFVIALLNDLLELDEAHRIVELTFVSTDQRPQVPELKLSIVDVKCIDAQGTHYVVEMQVLNVEGFERRVVYNASKAYVGQLRGGEEYPRLNDVVGVSICDFELWPRVMPGQPTVPMLSRWRIQEQHSGALGLSQIQYVFLELPKYTAGPEPLTRIDKWAFLFREADRLEVVPGALAGSIQGKALEEARMAHWTAEEWDAYDRSKVAEQDARGALTLAHREGLEQGREQGLEQGLRQAILDLSASLDIEMTAARRVHLDSFTYAQLKSLWASLLSNRRWPDGPL